MRMYLSGPIAGRPNANKETFEHYAALVRMAGADPLLPSEVKPDHEGDCPPDPLKGADGHSWSCHLRADIQAMLQCDAVGMLPGWERSHGARLENTVAAASGLPVFYFTGEYLTARTSAGLPLQQHVDEVTL